MLDNAVVFSLSANEELAEKIAKELGVPLGRRLVKRFPSGEIICEPVDTVRGKDVFIIQPTCPPVNENLMELLIFVDALKRASANVINVLVPYFGYARQDRKAKPRQPITSKLVADLFVAAGVDRVVTVDLHASQIQGFFSCLIDDLTAIPLLGYSILERRTNFDNVVVVSPDHGGVNRARKIAQMFKVPLAIIDKRRNSENQPEVMNIIGDVQGKECYMVDDIVDTAGSVIAGNQALKNAGATKVSLIATHAVFSDPAYERLSKGQFDEIIVTDSIPLPERFKALNVKVVSLAPMLAEIINRIENDEPLSVVYEKMGNVQ